MTTRRNLLIIAGGATLLGGCRDESRPGGSDRAEAVPDVVLAETRQGLVVLGGPHPRLLGPTAVTSPDGRLAGTLTRHLRPAGPDTADVLAARHTLPLPPSCRRAAHHLMRSPW